MIYLLCKVKLLYKVVGLSLEKNLLLAQLYDLYAPLLTTLQKTVMGDFLLKDLTISEIAENNGVSRQAIKDAVAKTEAKLLDYEDKLGFYKRLQGGK